MKNSQKKWLLLTILAVLSLLIFLYVGCDTGEENLNPGTATGTGTTSGTSTGDDKTTPEPYADLIVESFTVVNYDHSISIIDIGDFSIRNDGTEAAEIVKGNGSAGMGVYFYASPTQYSSNEALMEGDDVYFFGYGFVNGPFSQNTASETIFAKDSQTLDNIDKIPDAIIVNRNAMPNGEYYVYAWINMNGAVEEKDYDNNFKPANNKMTITGSGELSDKTVIKTYDDSNEIDTWLLLFTSIESAEGYNMSIVTYGGASNVCTNGGIEFGEVDFANSPILSPEQYYGSTNDSGFMNGFGGNMHNFLINAFPAYQNVYLTDYTSNYGLIVNDDNPWDPTMNDGAGGQRLTASVERYIPAGTVLHARVQVSPISCLSSVGCSGGRYGFIWNRGEDELTAYPGNCEGDCIEALGPLVNPDSGGASCDLESSITADAIVGQGASDVSSMENTWYKAQLADNEDVDWFTIIIP